ncbi:MAG: hypothetical protein HY060_10895 [Proteobacteria bacterium]|nr:hypothetical protein [Pseudomonadota bacterium]
MEYVLNCKQALPPDDDVEALAAALRRDLIPLGVWVVVRRPEEADAGLHGDCSTELQQRIDAIVRSIIGAHRQHTSRPN